MWYTKNLIKSSYSSANLYEATAGTEILGSTSAFKDKSKPLLTPIYN